VRSEPEGLLLVDKPSGPTSHDVVAWLRAGTGQPRIGHTGTLDPLACGLLGLVLGRATRLARFLPRSPKGYAGTFEIGRTTDTDDSTGRTLARHAGPLPDATAIRAAAARMTGRVRQRPPAFSARKVRGERMYRLARRGIPVQAPEVEIEVFSFAVCAAGPEATYRFTCEVSGGTYVRSLVRDLGQRLGCGALLTALRRESIGPLRVERALALRSAGDADPERVRAALIPTERMPLEPPPVRLADADAARRFARGETVDRGDCRHDGFVRVLSQDDRLLGIAECRNGGLHPRVVVAGADCLAPGRPAVLGSSDGTA
jgi:tRNA pseudouridine55 synthase